MTQAEAAQRTSNFEAVRRLLGAVSSGDVPGFLAGLADDVVYEAPYYADFGRRVGRDEVAGMLQRMSERFSSLNYDIVAEYPTLDPDLVIVECRGDNVLVGGNHRYRNHYLLFITFSSDGLVRRWREFSNPDVYRREAERSA